MPRFLYVFGYETPAQLRANAANGWDDEDSEALFIEAESEDEALKWGREVSERFMRQLHGDSSVSWTALGYAHWIEADPAGRGWRAEDVARLPVVRSGEFPAWDKSR
jgi:hypothetical protein